VITVSDFDSSTTSTTGQMTKMSQWKKQMVNA